MAGTGKFAEGTLVFVWNADQGRLQAVIDSIQKVLRPQSYPCKLCKLTYGIAGSRVKWANFLESMERPIEFYHRDEFRKTPLAKIFPCLELPAVLIYSSGKWKTLLSSGEIMEMKDLEALIGELKKRILKSP